MFDGLFYRHVGLGFEKQMRLASLLEKSGGGEWNLAIKTGKLTFGGKTSFDIQILGSHDDVNHTWLWAWGNKNIKPPEQALQAAQMLHDFGKENGIEAFTTALVPCAQLFSAQLVELAGHALATIAVGVLECDAYYAAPYENGCAFLLLKDERLEESVDNPLARIISTFPQALSGYPIADHKAALAGYLEDHGFEADIADRTLTVVIDGKKALEATFDEQGRLAQLDGKLG